ESSSRFSSIARSARASCGVGSGLSMKVPTCPSGSAPRNCETAVPLRNAMTFGIERTPKALDSSGFSSELTFTSLTRPAYWAVTFSSTGVSARHGPHQGAQKSTSTRCSREASITSRSKSSAAMSMAKVWLGRQCDNSSCPIPTTKHDLRCHRSVHQVQAHGLRGSLPGGLLLRGGEHARDPSGRVHRLRRLRARVPAKGDRAGCRRAGGALAQAERRLCRQVAEYHAQGKAAGGCRR